MGSRGLPRGWALDRKRRALGEDHPDIRAFANSLVIDLRAWGETDADT
jgi:hypothetical protein